MNPVIVSIPYRAAKKNTAYSTKLEMNPAGPVNCAAAMIAFERVFAIRIAQRIPARKIAPFFTLAKSMEIVGLPGS